MTQQYGGSSSSVVVAPSPSGDTSGATDNAALQAILTAFPASGGVLQLRPGTYYITGLTTSTPVTLYGQGPSERTTNAGATIINCTSNNGPAITVGARTFCAEWFTLKNTSGSTPVSGSAGILQSASGTGDGMRLDNLTVRGFYINIDIQNAAEWYMTQCMIYDFVLYGLRVANTLIPDGGDQYIAGNQFIYGPVNLTPSAGVRWESGGGMRFIANKLNGAFLPAPSTYNGFDLALADGGSTSDLLMVGNSIENTGTAGHAVFLHSKGPLNNSTFTNIVITGNQLYNGNVAISIAPAINFRNIVITGNAIQLFSFAYGFQNCNGLVYGTDSLFSVTTVTSFGTGNTNLTHAGPEKALGSQTVGTTQATIAHGLGYTPTEVIITPTTSQATGSVWRSAASDATNIFLTATAAGITCDVFVR